MADAAERALAIVGVSAIMPDAPNAATFWENIKSGRYSIREVPEERWDPAVYWDPDPNVPDKTYSKIGGWVRDWEWEPLKWRLPIPPKVADAMDDGQKWAVACARAVLADAGHPEKSLDLSRTAVVIGTAMSGNKHYMTSLRVFFPEYARALSEAPSFVALPTDVREAITRESYDRMREHFPDITEDTMPGELSNVMAGRVANLFDLNGPNFVCDAACASALAAIDAAHDGLLEGEFDAALVGGVDRNMGPPPFVKFSKIGALSATGTRPYGDGADGFVMGEGAAFFLVKRLADAETAGDRIYAVLRGIAGSSDGRGKGITAPNPVGQRLSVERGWQDAGLSPAGVGLIEGHGTSTRVGDVVEVGVLNEVLGASGLGAGTVALGSVKSNVGHLKGAAGAAGLLKTVLALHEKVLPPSLNAETPNPNIDFAGSPLFVNTELKPWEAPADGVRRAGVSAFGFGGTNYHAVLEEHVPGALTRKPTVQVPDEISGGAPAVVELAPPPRGALLLGEADAGALRARLEAVVADAEQGRAPAPEAPGEAALRAAERVAIDYGDAAELATKGGRALKAFAAPAEAQPGLWKALRSQGIFRGSGPAPKVAFLYTGQGSQYANMLRGLRDREPVVRAVFDEADRVLEPLIGRPLSEVVFVDPDDAGAVEAAEAELRRTEITQPAVLAVDNALTRLLATWGLEPDMVMGHSLGEYGALVAAGALPFEDALEAVSARGREMASLVLDDSGLMAAVFAPLREVEETLDGIEGNVVIANINSSSQAVIGGAAEPVRQAMAALEQAGHNVVLLPVSHAFHTTIVAPASAPLRQTLERLHLAPPTLPLVGNVDGELYPMGPDAREAMLDLLARQVASPVQFVKGLETLYAEGARVFVEVGPKKALHGFVEDVLGEREGVVALYTNHPKLGDATSLNHALCGLWAAGLGVGQRAQDAPLARPTIAQAPQPAAAAAAPVAGMPLAPGSDRHAALGKLVAEFLERSASLLGGAAPAGAGELAVVTGAALGLPGRKRVFDDANVQHILDGEQEIDLIPTRFRHAMVDKQITRLVKTGGDPHFEAIETSADVIKLAARAGALDLAQEFGVAPERVAAFDIVTKLAMAAGIEALRDAGIPLVMRYRTTTKRTQLPDRWMLPESLRDDTGVIFASAFPGYDSFADELTRWSEDHAREVELKTLRRLHERAERVDDGGVLRGELERLIHELEQEHEAHGYAFDRRFLFRVLPMAHAQFAEYVGARGPNTHVNSACASTTQAFALAEDWIAVGRCRRVVIIAADDATSDHLLEWIGSGFLATGAAATDDVVEEAALPFDRRRHGMILGMGAAGVVIEAPACARERGLRPICEVAATITANSAFHGTRLDVEHIGGVMERVVADAERRLGVDRSALARELVFVSHETYTPARGGSASAEVEALRHVFGAEAASIVVANTKGLTGHPMGVGIEDVVAIKALETGVVPPVPNYREPDPDLGTLNLSRGGTYPIRYALRLGAGFGSQISMALLRWCPSADGRRPQADELGFASRLMEPVTFEAWLRQVSGDDAAELEVVQRTLRVRDRGPAAAAREAARAASPTPQPVAQPAATAATPVAPTAPEPAPAAAGGEDPVRDTVLKIVAEKTGYPVDMLDDDLDLEADLGIDTVKQAETFAAIREAYDIPRDEGLQLRDYPTLAHAVQFVLERCPEAAGATASAPTAPVEAASSVPAAVADDTAAVRDTVLKIVAEKTGYPVDMLDDDLDLEADLGIDTVKQAETFAAIREAYDIPRDEGLQLRDYPTLAHAVQFVLERCPEAAGATASAPTAPVEAASSVPAAAADDTAAVRDTVLKIVAEKTGYPVDMLDDDLDLEADLGIDTVKQAETFAAIREAYDIPRDEGLQLREYPTLAHAVQFVLERRPGGRETAAPAEPQAAPSAPASAAADDTAAVRDTVLKIVAEKTGYPVDMLDDDLDLEADLGIDTVKQAETFAAIREAYNIPRDEGLQLREYPTLAHAVQFVLERRPSAGDLSEAASGEALAPTESGTEKAPAPAPSEGFALPAGDPELTAQLPRRAPVAVLRPDLDRCKPSGVTLEAGRRVVLMPDRGGVAKALTRRLQVRGVEVLTLDPASDAAALEAQLAAWRESGPVTGLYWLPALDGEGPPEKLDADAWQELLRVRVKLFYTAARALYDDLDGADRFLVSATRLGGRHGYDAGGATNPLGGAVTGFTKSFARERNASLVKAVDFPETRRTAEIADALLAETLHDPGAIEVGVRDELRSGVALVEQEGGGSNGLALGKDAVLLVTGAAGGIVSAIVADLASAGGGEFHLLDVVPEPDLDDPDLRRFSEDREGLQRELFERLRARGERATPVQVQAELSRIERAHAAASAILAVRAAGGTAHWHSVNLLDGEAVAAVVAGIAETSGRIDAIVHAAGLERSRSLPDKPPEEFDLVFDVKVGGWLNLLGALGDLPVGAVVFFSSIAGRFGNAGQADYSAANDLLCKMTNYLRVTRPGTLARTLDWTAWADIGMASRGSIPEIMARAGIDMLDPRAGIPVVRCELQAGGESGEILVAEALGLLVAERDRDGGIDPARFEVAAAGPLFERVTALRTNDGLCLTGRLDPASQPFLDHHRIEGVPVLPGVMGLECFAEAARVFFPGERVVGFEAVEFLAPFKLYRDEPRDFEVQALPFEDAEGVSVACSLVGRRLLRGQSEPQETLHFRARVRLATDPAEPAREAAPAGVPEVSLPAEDLYRIYFHGPAYQVVDRAWRDGDTLCGRFAEKLGPGHAPAESVLATAPRLIELCFQVAGAGEIAASGRMGLPSRIERVRLHGDGEAGPLEARVTSSAPEGPFDARVVDADGTVRVTLEGYATATLPQDLPDPLRAPLRAGLGMETAE